MRRAVSVLGVGLFPERAPVARVSLPYVARHRRRIRLEDDGGEPFLLDLARATVLGDGDRLVLDDGDMIEVRAAQESVVDVTCRDTALVARIAWHIGNRHVPLQILEEGGLRIQYDHVLVQMIAGLGGVPRRRDAPFAPEPGAYSGHEHAKRDE